ncbi:hypothetical protein MWL72_00545 [Escherichia coli]|nr:hypothetical protein [Escherichia coli]
MPTRDESAVQFPQLQLLPIVPPLVRKYAASVDQAKAPDRYRPGDLILRYPDYHWSAEHDRRKASHYRCIQ